MALTLLFQDPLATETERSGGKGANLARLTVRGFPVPPGFIVVAEGYQGFACVPAPLLAGLDTVPANDSGALRAALTPLAAALAERALPSALCDEVRARLATFPADTAFSVRSSATMEDLATAAFAGQHETYLNCSGAERILERIKDCYLSLWSERAVAYRRSQRFDHRLVAMAVVVQQMVPCEVAGVAFSLNPVSGDLGELVVDANFGLGESVVGGEDAVDHFTLDRATGAVRSAVIAAKTRRIVCDSDGTRGEAVDEQSAAQPALTAEQLDQLARLLLAVEQSYGFPQDIEWGFAGGALHLLQSRPITTIPPRWTRDESAERFPNVITPLTWDFVEDGFHRSLRHSLRLMGLPPFEGQWFGLHEHYVYGNQNAVELYARRMPFAPRSQDELRAAIPRLRDGFDWVHELPLAWHRDLDDYLLRIGELLAEPVKGLTTAEVWQYILRVNEHGAQYFLPNIAISLAHGTLYRLLHHILALAVGASDAPALCDQLLAYCETKTGLINRELQELADLVRAQPELRVALAGQPSRALVEQGALERFPEVKARFTKFLRDHGHREVDFDAYVPTWVEAPWVVLDNVRLMQEGPPAEAPIARERGLRVRQQQAERALFERLPEDLRFLYGEILRLTRLYTHLDDLEHYQTTRLTLPLRRGLHELGSRLVALDVIVDPSDVFFAHRAQIDEALRTSMRDGWRQLAAQIVEQKASYLAARGRRPEWVLGEAAASDEEAGGDALAGLPGSPGVAEGIVYVVMSSDDFGAFPKGAILVARTTNPAWTPLFYSAAAVVTESGGPLSHGAVTAREMRIPAVMSVKGVLARLQNGTRVRVDGSRGRVQVLE